MSSKRKRKQKLKMPKERIPTPPPTIEHKDFSRYSRRKKHKKGIDQERRA